VVMTDSHMYSAAGTHDDDDDGRDEEVAAA